MEVEQESKKKFWSKITLQFLTSNTSYFYFIFEYIISLYKKRSMYHKIYLQMYQSMPNMTIRTRFLCLREVKTIARSIIIINITTTKITAYQIQMAHKTASSWDTKNNIVVTNNDRMVLITTYTSMVHHYKFKSMYVCVCMFVSRSR